MEEGVEGAEETAGDEHEKEDNPTPPTSSKAPPTSSAPEERPAAAILSPAEQHERIRPSPTAASSGSESKRNALREKLLAIKALQDELGLWCYALISALGFLFSRSQALREHKIPYNNCRKNPSLMRPKRNLWPTVALAADSSPDSSGAAGWHLIRVHRYVIN